MEFFNTSSGKVENTMLVNNLRIHSLEKLPKITAPTLIHGDISMLNLAMKKNILIKDILSQKEGVIFPLKIGEDIFQASRIATTEEGKFAFFITP